MKVKKEEGKEILKKILLKFVKKFLKFGSGINESGKKKLGRFFKV